MFFAATAAANGKCEDMSLLCESAVASNATIPCKCHLEVAGKATQIPSFGSGLVLPDKAKPIVDVHPVPFELLVLFYTTNKGDFNVEVAA